MEQKKTRTGFLKKIGGFFRNNKPAKVAGLVVLGLAGIYLAVNFLRAAPLIVPHTAPEYYKSSEYGGNYASSGEYDSFASALQTESPMETAAGGMLGLFSARNAASLADDGGGTRAAPLKIMKRPNTASIMKAAILKKPAMPSAAQAAPGGGF